MTSKLERKQSSSTYKREQFMGKGYFTDFNKKVLEGEVGHLLMKKPRAFTIFMYFMNQYNHGALNKKTGIFPNSNKEDLSCPKSFWEKYTDKKTFDGCIDYLINLGLIKINVYRYSERKCTIYGLNDMWLNYGKKEFIILNEWKREQKQTL